MRPLIALLALVLVPIAVTAQPQLQPPGPGRAGMPPPRDTSRPAATGTSRIRGRIVAADTGQPLRRAVVRVFAPELRENRSTSTDERGVYEFTALPAGRYTVSASKGGYVGLNYGQRRPLESGKPLQIGENETAERIDVRLPRGGIITGRIVDEYGEPVANAMVQALQSRYMNGQKRPMNVSSPAMTPDNGEFRLWGLGPGEYVLSATLRDPMAMSGSVDDGRIGYAPTYYPGTANIAEAQQVTVSVGSTITDVTIALALTRTARVSGVAVDADGRPLAFGFVNLIQKDTQGAMMMGAGGAQVRPDGTFTISNVVPGNYIARAMSPPRNAGMIASSVSQADVTVSGGDIEGLRLSPVELVTVRGRVIVNPASTETLQPNQFRVTARPKSPAEAMMGMGPPEAVKEDSTFELKMLPGIQFVQLLPFASATNWQMKAIRVGGLDVTDTGIDARSGEAIDDLEIEVTGQVPVVSGTVTTSKGTAATDYTVIAFAQDPTVWAAQAPGRIGTTRPDQQGGFEIKSLRPGSYFIVAVEYVEQGQWTDPDYLETLRPQATQLTLGEADTKRLTLKLLADR